jgi:hypothetical protein
MTLLTMKMATILTLSDKLRNLMEEKRMPILEAKE